MISKPLHFTQHQLKRMSKRGISKSIVEAVFEKGVWKDGNKPSSYEIEYKGIIIVVYENNSQYNVSTCKLNRDKTLEAEKLKDELGIDFFKAMHKVVKNIDFSE